MKKLIAKSVILLASISLMIATVIGTAGIASASPITDKLLPTYYLGGQGGIDSHMSDLEAYDNLPDISYDQFVVSVIKTLLFLASSLVVIGLLVVGAMYMMGSVSEESMTTAKKILGYIGIGIIILSVSYAVVTGVMQIDFFAQ